MGVTVVYYWLRVSRRWLLSIRGICGKRSETTVTQLYQPDFKGDTGYASRRRWTAVDARSACNGNLGKTLYMAQHPGGQFTKAIIHGMLGYGGRAMWRE